MRAFLLAGGLSTKRVGVLLSAAALALMPIQARAHGALLFDIQSLALLISSASFCVTYTHDENGNRVSQVTTSIGSGAVNWGTGRFGCFVWHN